MSAKAPARKGRKIASTATKEIPTEFKELAVKHYVQNKAMNSAKGQSEKARAALYGKMKESLINSFDFETSIDGSPVALAVEIASGTQEQVSSEKLMNLFEKGRISREQFVSVISASKASMEKLGKDLFAQVAVTVPTSENVKVKPKG